jgi:hypothetical protein
MSVCETTVHPMDGMFEPSRMSSRRVDQTFYERNGPWQACMLKVSVARFYDLHTIPAFIPYPPLANSLPAL